MSSNIAVSYAECSARERLALIVDRGSFHEWLPPAERVTSPHLAQLGVPCAFDDGVAIGRATLSSRPVFIAAQEGEFMGGGVGEVHGAKLVGLLRRALRDRPNAVLLLAESGGVRLHEANAGLIAVSEVMRALLDVRAAGIPAQVSYHAGTYLCNATLYFSCYLAERMELKTRSTFIHLPLAPAQTAEQAYDLASLPVETMAEALRWIVDQMTRGETA